MLFRLVAPPAMLASAGFVLFFFFFIFIFSSLFCGFSLVYFFYILIFLALALSVFKESTDPSGVYARQALGFSPRAIRNVHVNNPKSKSSKGVLMIHPRSECMQSGRWPAAKKAVSFALVPMLLMFSSCATCRKTELAQATLSEQVVLLQRLKTERADPKVVTKIQSDADLSSAESHLFIVIETLLQSNAALQSAL
jgi:hypothetical protein